MTRFACPFCGEGGILNEPERHHADALLAEAAAAPPLRDALERIATAVFGSHFDHAVARDALDQYPAPKPWPTPRRNA